MQYLKIRQHCFFMLTFYIREFLDKPTQHCTFFLLNVYITENAFLDLQVDTGNIKTIFVSNYSVSRYYYSNHF